MTPVVTGKRSGDEFSQSALNESNDAPSYTRIEAKGHPKIVRQHGILIFNRFKLKFYSHDSAKLRRPISLSIWSSGDPKHFRVRWEQVLKPAGVVFIFIGILAVYRVVIRNKLPHRLLPSLLPKSWT